MIYKKDANFPYPILTNTSNSYDSSNFILDIELHENTKSYKFEINYDIESEFILNLLKNNEAKLILVVQSKDNKFYELGYGEKHIDILKSRISLSKRTVLQLLIQSKYEINFDKNQDLNSFYDSFKDEIIVPKNSVLGFSNIVTFDGSQSKPLDLFEKKVDSDLRSDIKIELTSETIVINYKNEELQFNDSHICGTLNNPYIYMGLQKAIFKFIHTNSEDGEVVYLDDIDVPEDGLDLKLYNLMKSKAIKDVSMENMDEVIHLISDRVIEKYTSAVRGLYK